MVDEVLRGQSEASEVAEESESLILVDEADREIGHMSKLRCHQGRGILHRAFSVLIFNRRGELLLQQRAATKPLWPLYWSNSCCSHPRRFETMDGAVHRRLQEELGLRCALKFLFKFHYQAQFEAVGAENEICSVYIGRCNEPVRFDQNEILATRWISPDALQRELTAGGTAMFTPWFILEWGRIWRDHRQDVLTLL
jgi:isopentenyl-diphosphate Delta-isomerase